MEPAPFQRLRNLPARRPGDIAAVGKNFRFGVAMAIAKHVDIGVARIGAGQIRTVVHAAGLMRAGIGMAQCGTLAHFSSPIRRIR